MSALKRPLSLPQSFWAVAAKRTDAASAFIGLPLQDTSGKKDREQKLEESIQDDVRDIKEIFKSLGEGLDGDGGGP